MNTQNSIFTKNIFGSNSGIIKKGQAPAPTTNNIFAQNTSTSMTATNSGTNPSSNPFSHLFSKNNTNTNNTTGIFGQKNPPPTNSNSTFSFFGKPNTQNASPFSRNTTQGPFSKLGQSGQTGQSGQIGQNNSGGNFSFSSIFNKGNQVPSSQSNPTGIFPSGQGAQNIFSQPTQTSTFTIGQQQPQNSTGIFPFQQQQQNSIFHQNQQQPNFSQFQLPTNLQNALSSYLQNYQHQLGNKPPFGQTQQELNASLAAKQKYPFDPTRHDQHYYNFLNHLLTDQIVKKHASPAELARFASQWADHNISYPPSQQQVHKLFDAHALPHPQMQFLPPQDITPELIQSLNDPLRTKEVMRTLAQQLRVKLHLLKQTMLMCEESLGGSGTKVKDLGCFKEIAMLWTELRAFQRKVREMREKDHEIQRKGEQFEQNVREVCLLFKERFVEVNRNAVMVQEARQDIEQLSKYLEYHIQPVLKALATSSPQTFQEPDDFVLSIAASLASRTKSLAQSLDDCLAILSQGGQEEEKVTDTLELIHNLCLYYQKVAETVFRVSEKMRKTVNILEREKHWKEGSIEKKVGEKVKVALAKKLEAYSLVNEIERILMKRQQGPQTERME